MNAADLIAAAGGEQSDLMHHLVVFPILSNDLSGWSLPRAGDYWLVQRRKATKGLDEATCPHGCRILSGHFLDVCP